MAAGLLLMLVGLAMIMMGCPFAHGAIAVKHHNSLGVVQYEDNPYTYLEGSIVSGAFIEDRALNLRVQPRATYALFTQDVLFCDIDEVAARMNGKSNPVVLVYETVAHRTIEGVGCHELIAVDEVKSEKP